MRSVGNLLIANPQVKLHYRLPKIPLPGRISRAIVGEKVRQGEKREKNQTEYSLFFL